jgi:hypothetical protein
MPFDLAGRAIFQEGIMTAVLYDDVVTVTTPPAPRLTLAPAPKQSPKRLHQRPTGDPMLDVTARLLSIPLRHVYAVLWRAGLIEVTA